MMSCLLLQKYGKIDMSLPKLSGTRVILRALEINDADGNYPSWLNDPIVTQFNSHGQITYTKAMAKQYIASVLDSNTHHVFAIIYNQKHIGNIALQNIDKTGSHAEFAILIGEPSVYGKGIGKEAGALLLDYGFNTLGLLRIYCGTASNNIGMQHLAVKLGMKKEAQRKDGILKNGKKFDVFEYSISKRSL